MAATQEQTVNSNLPSGSDGTHPAKSVLKEAVDAVLNSFAKHTHGYGRGKLKVIQTRLIIYKQRHGPWRLTFVLELTVRISLVFSLRQLPLTTSQLL